MLQENAKYVENLRQALKLRPDKYCALMLDTQGPEIRTGKNKDGKSISLKQGQILEISTDFDVEGDENVIGCNYESLPDSVEVGGTVFI